MNASSTSLPACYIVSLLLTGLCALACGGANTNGSLTKSYGSGQAPRQTCKMNADGTEVCGYHCLLGSGGGWACADSPEGSCSVATSGEVSCQGDELPEPPAPAASNDEPASSPQSSGSDAMCCVNLAYYDCPDAAAATLCLGSPMQLMSCMQECGVGGDGSCEEACSEDHGARPDEAGCERNAALDGQCI